MSRKRIKGSVKFLGKKLGIPYAEALPVLKFLESKGVAVFEGDRSKEGRGRPLKTYSLPKGEVTINLV
jgi:predicted ArsR family transcriptional regulator